MTLSTRYLRYLKLNNNGYDRKSYPFNIPAVQTLAGIDFDNDITFLVGENGAGKSTILEAVASVMDFNPEGGTKQSRFSTANTHSILHSYLIAAKGHRRLKSGFFLRAESFYNMASYLEQSCSPYAPDLHDVSHGESFMKALYTYASSDGLYLLDEPEAALSVSRQMECLALIRESIKGGSQFIIATHSPILLSYPGAKIYQLDEKGFLEVEYEETEAYVQTKYFINNYDKLTQLLVGDMNK